MRPAGKTRPRTGTIFFGPRRTAADPLLVKHRFFTPLTLAASALALGSVLALASAPAAAQQTGSAAGQATSGQTKAAPATPPSTGPTLNPVPQAPAQAPAGSPPPTQAPAQAPTTPAPGTGPTLNSVPVAPTAPTPPTQTQQALPDQANRIAGIECHGNHRVPCETIKTKIGSTPGEIFDPAQINRDFMNLWNSGFFDDIRIERQNTPEGIILHVYVTEKPLVRRITYKGLKSITESDVLDRYKARNVQLSIDSPFDPVVEKHAEDAIKELLQEHGRQYATVKAVVTALPPSSVELTFNVDEGPKVEVGNINFVGNHVLSANTLRNSMTELHPVGIPHSLIFENLFPKTYDQAKLSQDLESIRSAYQDRGYFEALVEDPTLKLRSTRSHRILFWGGSPGREVDITIPLVEGAKYRIGTVTFINNRFIVNRNVLLQEFGIKPGDIVDLTKMRKGIQNLTKLYGRFGYINFVANPNFTPDETRKIVNVTLDMEEGKPFFVRRIEFSGNTTTRDKVIRRALLIGEGERFNNEAWENSLLRLNQLGYFDELKPEDATITQDTTGPEGHVDIDLHVKEKGKNTIGLNGGVSGIAGSFLGLNYTTNNFLGLGETLSLSGQYGSLQQNVTFGFTEPYLYDRPLQLAFTVYTNDFHYDQAREASILTGENLVPYFSALGANNLLNYAQNSKGFTIGASYPRRRKFTRVGITYGYDISNIQPFTSAATLLFNSVAYQGFSGPSSLTGITTSRIVPSLTINTVNAVDQPTAGKELDLSFEATGLGGNVKLWEPSATFRYFHRSPVFSRNVIGFRLMGSIVKGYDGQAPPTFDRFYSGGEDSIRGFDIMAVTPIALIPTETTTDLLDPQNPNQPLTLTVPSPTPGNPAGTSSITFPIKIPVYQFATPGGDTLGVANFEYRIPLVGPVTLALFTDVGVDMVTQSSQLQVNNSIINQLQGDFNRHFSSTIPLAPGTNGQVRMSVGPELQVMMPVIHAPFRLYFADNPMHVDTVIYPPTLFTQADFERSIPAAFQTDALVQQSVQFTMHQLEIAPGTPFKEAPHVLRFTISRTF